MLNQAALSRQRRQRDRDLEELRQRATSARLKVAKTVALVLRTIEWAEDMRKTPGLVVIRLPAAICRDGGNGNHQQA